MIKDLIRPVYNRYRRKRELAKFKKGLAKNQGEIKVVVGSSEICPEGWLPTEEHFLNLLVEDEWRLYFKENTIANILAEHVWEHLSLEDGSTAAGTCYKFLSKGGKLRIAVPDGYHPDKEYIDYVKPGGAGAGAFDHKVLYNYESLSKLLTDIGYRTELLEYFDEDGSFHTREWSDKDGHIHRSLMYDKRNKDGKPHYTSIIIDAIK